MWKLTLTFPQDAKPKISEIGGLLDKATDIRIEEFDPDAPPPKVYRDADEEKYRDVPFSEIVARHAPRVVAVMDELNDSGDLLPQDPDATVPPVHDGPEFIHDDNVSGLDTAAAFRAGADAYVDGGRADDNPYPRGSAMWKSWGDGYASNWGAEEDPDDDKVC